MFTIVIRVDSPEETKQVIAIADTYGLEYTLAPHQIYLFISTKELLAQVALALKDDKP